MLHPRLPRSFLSLLLAVTLPLVGRAQFTLQDSNTTASLRGISAPGNGVAWASGTGGTVLRTEDGGYVWQGCAMPPGAEKLDFRGIQAFDGQTALIMSSGKGDLSRVYKTTDGCRTWKLVFTNPDADGFFDTLYVLADMNLVLVLGDPVRGSFQLFTTSFDTDPFTVEPFHRGFNDTQPLAKLNEAAFAASNSLIAEYVGEGSLSFATGGTPEIIHEEHGIDPRRGAFSEWSAATLPLPSGPSAGAFSLAGLPYDRETKKQVAIIVGGDYAKPETATRTAIYSVDGGYTWKTPDALPHGYRSSVAYDAPSKTWITVGPNGTDLSRDDGRHWSPLRPGKDDASDADKNWNALSLPFVVGPHGRIGRLRDDALRPPR